jgi:two-component system, NtrC family, sensor histidine kinase HydH
VTDSYAELAELAGRFVHEIKNPLSTLKLNLQLLAEDFQDAQSQRERRALTRIQRLQGECQRLEDKSNEFLRFARISPEGIKAVPADMASVIAEMIDFFSPTAQSAHIDIKPYISGDLPLVQLDRDLFEQAVLNLMLNAQQAMPAGGELTIQALREEVNNQPQVCLSFIDTGKGMTPEVAAKIFQPFFSTKPSGSGLGLPTTRKIVEAHGGTIEVQSEVDRGTKFTVRLPAMAERPAPSSGS